MAQGPVAPFGVALTLLSSSRPDFILCSLVLLPLQSISLIHPSSLSYILHLAAFRPLLHEAISSGLADGVDDIQINGALQTQFGWMHINGMCTNLPVSMFGAISCSCAMASFYHAISLWPVITDMHRSAQRRRNYILTLAHMTMAHLVPGLVMTHIQTREIFLLWVG